MLEKWFLKKFSCFTRTLRYPCSPHVAVLFLSVVVFSIYATYKNSVESPVICVWKKIFSSCSEIPSYSGVSSDICGHPDLSVFIPNCLCYTLSTWILSWKGASYFPSNILWYLKIVPLFHPKSLAQCKIT